MNRSQRIPFRASIAVFMLAAGTLALTGGCASQPSQPESMLDPQADFNAYKTFGWFADPKTDASGQPATLVDGYIRTAIVSEMKRKGYEQAPAGTKPDLRVEYEAARAEKLKNNPFRIGVGVGSYGSNVGGGVGVSSPSVKNVQEGSLVIHVVDTARNAEVWRSGVSRELGKGNIEPAIVNGVVAEVFKDFPARGGQP